MSANCKVEKDSPTDIAFAFGLSVAHERGYKQGYAKGVEEAAKYLQKNYACSAAVSEIRDLLKPKGEAK